MAWHGIQGHDEMVARFRLAIERGRLASTFLFVGPAGIGKRTFALKLAQTLLCQGSPPAEMSPCGTCDACRQVLAGTHPDLERISKPEDKSVIPVERFIGPPERRMQEGLCHNISLKPFMGGRRIAIIDDADFLAVEGANALLKTLEEPPPKSVLILIGTTADKQLPTIRSRCQVMRFQPLGQELLLSLLKQKADLAAINLDWLSRGSGGSLERAAELADPALWEFRGKLLATLATLPHSQAQTAAATQAFVDEAGKEAPLRRARLRQVIGFAAEFYRQALRVSSGSPGEADQELSTAIQQAAVRGPIDAEAALVRCLDALEQVDRNAQPAAVVSAWLDDLGQISARRPLAAGL
ncbi:MAG: ATP-binding protein [Pirellulales bacterium]